MSGWDLKKAIGHKEPKHEIEINNKNAILYALGIGFQRNPMNKDHFNFTYEDADEFQAFPTMAVVLAHIGHITDFKVPGVPEFSPMKLLHGEEQVEVFKPIEMDSTVTSQETVIDLQDKKKATVMVTETEIRDKESNDLLAVIRSNYFIRGIGGFGERGKIKSVLPNPPKRQPDFIAEEKTEENQAFLYRLSGDRNPLHVDP